MPVDLVPEVLVVVVEFGMKPVGDGPDVEVGGME